MQNAFVRNMFRQIKQKLRSLQPLLLTKSQYSTEVSAERWDLYAGVLVERLPVLSKKLNSIEERFQNHLWKIEHEKSFKSNHEMKHERDLAQSELIKKGQIEIDLDDMSSKQTAQDLVDLYTEEAKQFKLANRQTSFDIKNDILSPNRQLEETLYLLMEQKIGNKAHFLLPQGPRLEGETMRQTAERIVKEKCGETLDVMFYGNAPCGFYKYKYPSPIRTESIGAKVFFFRAALQTGNVNEELNKNFAWLAKNSLDERVQNATYLESVHKFLLH